MKIVADENIPNIEYYFKNCGEILTKPGREITAIDVKDADILLVRSVTKVNEKLLTNSKVKFVGSTTIGDDHLDKTWLRQKKIHYATAKGCNAQAVAEYVIACIAVLSTSEFLANRPLRAAIIGVGDIGSRVANLINALGWQVLLYDPPRALRDKTFQSCSKADLTDLDFISIHTPLTQPTQSEFPTLHLINKAFLQQQKPNTILLNAGRGEVIDSNDLNLYGENLIWCLDVWENEPFIDSNLLANAYIATPHIAGYSVQSKLRGIQMIYEKALQLGVIPKQSFNILKLPILPLIFDGAPHSWQEVVLAVFDPLAYTDVMKNTLMEDFNHFDWLRKTFNYRHEFAYVKLQNLNISPNDQSILRILGFNI
jgi:erythronate-4-phosphate dehydrogenase